MKTIYELQGSLSARKLFLGPTQMVGRYVLRDHPEVICTIYQSGIGKDGDLPNMLEVDSSGNRPMSKATACELEILYGVRCSRGLSLLSWS